ncbi:universal stress protein [Actinomadura viridis]|uniref:universal stress protein n=1 Tax=Actinomadura viridis TaxID=58110 RepID=UPI00369640B2
MSEPIVVGVDGSPQALYAVDWAAAEAGRRRVPLRIVHIAARWEYHVRADAEPGLGAPRPEAAGLRVLEAAEERAAAFASVEVGTRLGVGHIPRTLLEEAAGAALLVLGAHGTGGLTRLLLGSVSRQATEHARCPVVIVPPDTGPRNPEVVVGIDGSESSADAVGFALEEAALRDIGLLAVHAWSHPESPPGIRPAVYDKAEAEREGARLLSEALAGWTDREPGVPVTQQVVEGGPVPVLIEASRTAELLVVGARGRGGFPGLHLGSTSHAVLHQAKGPVAVVRRHPERTPPG